MKTNDQQVSYISGLRNKLERDLREVFKTVLKSVHGSATATRKVLAAIPTTRRDGLAGKTINELLDRTKPPPCFFRICPVAE